jgi:hypothetical protein
MDTRKVVRIVAIVVAVYLALKLVVFPSLFALIILGTLPGTAIAIPDGVYLLVAPLLSFSALYWLYKQTPYIGEVQTVPAAPVKVKRARKKPVTVKRKAAPARRRAKATV